MSDIHDIEDLLVKTALTCYDRYGVVPRQGRFGVVREDGLFVVNPAWVGTIEIGCCPVGIMLIGETCDEELQLYEDICRLIGDHALVAGISQGFDGRGCRMGGLLDEDRKFYWCGHRVGQRVYKELFR